MCPPHVDQTERGPESWQIIVPRLRQSRRLPPSSQYHSNSPNKVIFNPKYSWGAWEKLARPVPTSLSIQGIEIVEKMGSTGFSAWRTPNSVSPLEKLPAELQLQLLGYLSESEADTLAFGLTCTGLLYTTLSYIAALQVQASAPWAGLEIACTGTYLTDLPESFEKEGLALNSIKRPLGTRDMCMARKIHWSAWKEYQQVGEEEEGSKGWSKALLAHDREAAGISVEWYEEIKTQLSGSVRLFPKDVDFVLRNLDTKELVSCRPGHTGQGYVKHGNLDLDWLRVEDLLLLLICWTRHPRGGANIDEKSWTRGRWAGHRFDILPLELHEAETPNSQTEVWKDVTENMVTIATLKKTKINQKGRHLAWNPGC